MPLYIATNLDEAARRVDRARRAVVVVPVYNAPEDVLRCLDSLFVHTPSSATILIIDDHGIERRAIRAVARAAENVDHRVVLYERPENGGFVRGCNDAFSIAGANDVILVNSDVVVGPEWYDRISMAAASSPMVATVSTLTNFGTILSVPHRNRPVSRLTDGFTPDAAAKAVAEASLNLLPTIPTGIGHCLYIRRAALNAVGYFDLAFSNGYGEEVDLCQRALRMGFKHICADDVFVYHRGNASFGDTASDTQVANEAIVNARYPWYQRAVSEAMLDEFSPLAHAIETARRALVGYRIGIDARCLGWHWAGTQVVTYNTIVELCRRLGDGRVVVYADRVLPPRVAREIASLGGEIEYVDDLVTHNGTKVDVLYRPSQIGTFEELRFLVNHGNRVVVSQLDLIAWANPAYFSNDAVWMEYRELTRTVLRCIEGVTFISSPVRDAVLSEDLLPRSTPSAVTYCGTDSFVEVGKPSPVEGWTQDDRPLLLCLGNAYTHKNRVFALRLVAALSLRGIDARLVIVGASPPFGASQGDEAALYLEHPELRRQVTELADISEEQKEWLYAQARLVLYPTISEGFGLVPFEAARRGVPSLCTRQGSLAEVLPDDMPTIADFDLDAATDLTIALMSDEATRAHVCATLRNRAEHFTWERTVDVLLEHFDEVMRRPRNRAREALIEDELSDQARRRKAPRRRSLERQITQLQAMTTARRVLAPSGSRRQSLLRTAVNWARVRADLADTRR